MGDKKKKPDLEKLARFAEVLDIVCENVAYEWPVLAKELGLSKLDTNKILAEKSADCCWEALQIWRTKTVYAGQVHDLVEALLRCRQRRLADIVGKIMYSTIPVEQVLAQHLEREDVWKDLVVLMAIFSVKMLDALYLVADGCSHHWRQLGKTLGLSPLDIGFIDGQFPGRPREKCMNALYKWRSLVVLQDYKITSIIQALRECGLQEMSAELALLASEGKLPYPVRKRKKGELFIQIGIEEMDIHPPRSAKSEPRTQDHQLDTSRPRKKIPDETLKLYALNKIFYRLIDGLDVQDREGTHKLVSYFCETMKIALVYVSRKDFYMIVQCFSLEDAEAFWKAYLNKEVVTLVNRYMVGRDVLDELGTDYLRLSVSMRTADYKKCKEELPEFHVKGMTPRPEYKPLPPQAYQNGSNKR